MDIQFQCCENLLVCSALTVKWIPYGFILLVKQGTFKDVCKFATFAHFLSYMD